MPPRGRKTITVSEKIHNLLAEMKAKRAKERGLDPDDLSMNDILTEILHEYFELLKQVKQ